MGFAETALEDVTFFPFWLDDAAAPVVQPQLILEYLNPDPYEILYSV